MKIFHYVAYLFIAVSNSSQALVPYVDIPNNKDNIESNNTKTLVFSISHTYTPISNSPMENFNSVESGKTNFNEHPENQLITENTSTSNQQIKPSTEPTIIIVQSESPDSSNKLDSKEIGIDGVIEQPDIIEKNNEFPDELQVGESSLSSSNNNKLENNDNFIPPIVNTFENSQESTVSPDTLTNTDNIENLLDNLIEPEQVALEAISPTTLRTFVTVVDLVRREYVENVNDEQLFANAMQGMLKNLDPHAEFLDAQSYENLQAFTQGELANIGMHVEFDNGESAWVVQSVDDKSPAKNAGIKQGFFLHKINDVHIDKRTIAIDIEQRLNGIAGSMVDIVMSDAGRRRQKYTLQRTLTKKTPIDVLFDRGVAIVNIPVFQDNTRQQVLDALIDLNRPIHGVVLDVRNNPGGVLGSAVDVAGLFIEKQGIVQIKDKDGKLTLMSTEGDAYLKDIPLIVLQNRYSASAAEVLASGIQSNNRGTIIGETSYGKGTVQSVIPIENNQAVKLTVAHYLRPDGTKINGEGVKADITLARDGYNKLYNNLFRTTANSPRSGKAHVGRLVYQHSNSPSLRKIATSKKRTQSTSKNSSISNNSMNDTMQAKLRNERQWQKQAIEILLEQIHFKAKQSNLYNRHQKTNGISDTNNLGFHTHYYNHSKFDKESPVPLDLKAPPSNDIDLSENHSSNSINISPGILLVYPNNKKEKGESE